MTPTDTLVPPAPDTSSNERHDDAPVDPRIRERRVAVTRAQGRRRLRVLLVLVTSLSLLGIVWLVVHSPFLAVHEVRITGVEHVTAAAVRQAADVHDGDALLRVNTGAVARRVETLPWVARAKVSRSLPQTLEITVEERAPVAWVRRTATVIALVDRHGRVLADAATPPAGVPELVGMAALGAPGREVQPRSIAAVISTIPADLAAMVRRATVDPTGVSLQLGPSAAGPPRASVVQLGPPTQVRAKGEAALAVLNALTRPVGTVDGRVPSAPTTR